MDELGEALVSAILDSVDGGKAEDCDAGLAGYALITDADMRTVYGASASRGFIEEEGDESVLFMPVDWTTEHHTASFDLASERLAATSFLEGQGYDERVRSISGSFVSALRNARTQRAALQKVTLLVVCADGGGDVWRQVEQDAVRILNDAATYERWTSAMGS